MYGFVSVIGLSGMNNQVQIFFKCLSHATVIGYGHDQRVQSWHFT